MEGEEGREKRGRGQDKSRTRGAGATVSQGKGHFNIQEVKAQRAVLNLTVCRVLFVVSACVFALRLYLCMMMMVLLCSRYEGWRRHRLSRPKVAARMRNFAISTLVPVALAFYYAKRGLEHPVSTCLHCVEWPCLQIVALR